MSDEHAATAAAHEMLTLMEAAAVLRIGRTTAYELAREYLRTSGTSGLPVVRIGKQLRVARSSLNDVMNHGTPATNQPSAPTHHRRNGRPINPADNPPRLFTIEPPQP